VFGYGFNIHFFGMASLSQSSDYIIAYILTATTIILNYFCNRHHSTQPLEGEGLGEDF
jgi:hypothetical protein